MLDKQIRFSQSFTTLCNISSGIYIAGDLSALNLTYVYPYSGGGIRCVT